MAELRSSIFRDMIGQVRRGIADITEKEQYTDKRILEEIKRGIADSPHISGMVSAHRQVYAFVPIDQNATLYNKDIYENNSNMTTNYHLTLTDSGSEGVIETKANVVNNMQIALVTIGWNESGATGDPVLDISLDKDPASGDRGMPGSWLAETSRIAVIKNGVEFDISDIPSPSFSVRWTLPSGSDKKILDTTVMIVLVNSSRLMENKSDVVYITIGNILSEEANVQAKNSNVPYAEFLEGKANNMWAKVRGRLGGGISSSLGVKAIQHNYDRSSKANKAFNMESSLGGDWVEIMGPDVYGAKRLRRIY